MSRYVNVSQLVANLKQKEVKEDNKNEFSKDTWKATVEKDQDAAEYVIRFLPNPDSSTGVPWVSRPAHMIKFPSGNFIYEPCPKKAKKGECTICKKVNDMYQSGSPTQEKIASGQYAKPRFFLNILVVKDPRDNGANEGKIFIFEVGKKIMDKLKEVLTDEDDRMIFFDPIDGNNFKIKMTITAGEERYPNYDNSKFLKASRLADANGKEYTDDQIDEIMDKCHKLEEKLLSDKAFKSDAELVEIYKNQGYSKKEKGETSEKTQYEKKVVASKSSNDDDDAPVAPKKPTPPPSAPKAPSNDVDDIKTVSAPSEEEDAELQKLLED